MDMRKAILLMVITGALTACGGVGESGEANKSLFSEWTSTSTGLVMDLRNAGYGPQAFRYYTASNNGCDCTLEILGNNESGTAPLSSCTHFGPTDVCSSGTTIYNYTNQNNTLSLCNGGCEDYQ